MSKWTESDDVSPIVFQCSRCGLPSTLGSGFNISALACHLPMADGEEEQATDCRSAGGPFDGDLNARALEDRYRQVLGLPFLRERSGA